MTWFHRFARWSSPAALIVSMAAMAACANGSTATTTTAACPTSQTTALKTINGTIVIITGDTLTIKDTSGASSVVHLSTTTRYTRLQSVAASSLTPGTAVQVLTQPSSGSAPTTAQTIIVQPTTTGQNQNSGGSGQGSSGFGQGSGTGGFGQGRGSSSFGQGQRGSSFANCRTQSFGAAASFRGLAGTVKIYNATNQQLIVADAQGTPFLIAIAATTSIGSTAQGSQSDLQQGENVSIRGTATNGGIIARQIQILANGQG